VFFPILIVSPYSLLVSTNKLLYKVLRVIKKLGAGNWHNRLGWLKESDVEDILNRITPVLNTKANSGAYEYGFVIYPK